MSNNFEKSTMSKDIQSVESPSSKSLGALEPVAFFNDAMPTGVTVSHKDAFL